jgi:hypothetical protein
MIKDWKQYTDEKHRKQWSKGDMILAVLQIQPNNPDEVSFVKVEEDSDGKDIGFCKRVKDMDEGIRRAKQYMKTH